MYVDKREKIPLLFPETLYWFPERGYSKPHLFTVNVKKKRLPEGDYLLARWPKGCIIERKGSPGELRTNLLTADYTRALAAFKRLATFCRAPYLLLDFTLTEGLRETTYNPEPRKVMDAMFRLLCELKIGLIWAGSCKAAKPRRLLGEQMIRLMLAHNLGES